MTEWQESVVSVHVEESAPVHPGSRFQATRRALGGERTTTSEVKELIPPRSWSIRGIDGPVRANIDVTVEPADGGSRSRLTLRLDFEGHGIGRLLVPLVVRPQTRRAVPRNVHHLEERFEQGS